MASVDRILADVAGAVLVAMMLGTAVSSLGRYLFAWPIPDFEAISEMLLVAVILLPMAYTQSRREHVEVSLFTDGLSLRARRTLVVLGWIVGLLSFSILAYALGSGATRAYASGDAYLGVNQIVTWPARAIAVVGIVALALRLCLDLATRRRDAALMSPDISMQKGSE